MHRRGARRVNGNALVLCGLVFFVIVATIFCMAANAREAAKEQKRIAAEKQAEEEAKKAEEAKLAAVRKAEEERKKASSVQPGVPIGTTEVTDDEKVVYLTFDDGPSENTEEILKILEKYNVKATFFITGEDKSHRYLIKEAYDAGHTIGLHTYSHKYSEVYASVDAYFEDLEKIGEIAKEQLGFVPCFIRFPGGASNLVSAQYCKEIMSELVNLVQEKGYQYYDWNLDSGDGAGKGKDELIKNSQTDKLNHIMLLCHDAGAKHETVEALPSIIEYYQQNGYEFRAIDRESYVVHHKVNN